MPDNDRQAEDSTTGLGVQTPDIDPSDPKLKVRRRAIHDEAQAANVFSALVQAQEGRNKLNAEIVARYTGKQPKDPQDLIQQGRDWESNFPTLFLAGIVDRVVPNMINAIDSQRYLTQATLPDELNGRPIENRAKKIEAFRDKVSQTIRRWRGWRNLCATLCQELVLIGYLNVCWTDEDDWRGTVYRQDKAFVPEGSPQFAEYFQFFAIKQDMLLHGLVDIIQNREAADSAGWVIENAVESINHALPQDPQQDEGNNARVYADVIREGNQGASYMTGAKVIKLGHLFATEPDKLPGKGRVSHYIIDRDTKKFLFERERRFNDMNDVTVPFTLEPGNGTFYGSKGLGRMLSNFSAGVDMATNDAVNQMKMSGLLVLKTDAKSALSTQIKVRAPFAIITSDAALQKEQFQVDVEGFIAMINQLTRMAEIAANAYIPNQLSEDQGSGKRTAREATIDYTRELQSKSAVISRFAGQFAEMIGQKTKRLCKPDTSDEEAQRLQQELQDEGLSDEEIKLLAESPAMEVVQDLTGVQNQQKAQLATELAGNPMVDQKALLEARIIAQTDQNFAREIMLPDANDPTMEAEQVRQQIIENAAIMVGESVPVSPRDNDKIHLSVLASELKNAGMALSKQDPMSLDPQLLDHIHAGMMHGEGHLQSWEQKGGKPEDLQPFKQFLAMVDQALKKVAVQIKQQSIKAHQVLAHQAAIQQQDTASPATAPTDSAAPAGGGVLTEKVLVAWIGQYENLRDTEKRLLETVGGLGSAPDAPSPTPQPETPTPSGQDLAVSQVSVPPPSSPAPTPAPPAPVSPQPAPVVTDTTATGGALPAQPNDTGSIS